MDLVHELTLPLTIAALCGAAGVVRYWVNETNKQIANMNVVHERILGIINGAEAMNNFRLTQLETRVTRLEHDDHSDGYA